MNLNEMFQQAVTHHQAGRFAEAEELYLRVLQAEPKHPDANHNLGLMAMQLSQAEVGLPYLQAAWEADPSVGAYWLTLTECLLEMGHSEEALLLIEKAIRRGMESPQAQQLLVRAKSGQGAKTKPAEVITDGADVMAGHLEEGAQVAKRLNVVSRHTLSDMLHVSPMVTENNNSIIEAEPDGLNMSAREVALPQQEIPELQDIPILMNMFNMGRYTEAAMLAHKMTARFPMDGFGWKVLGAIFKQTGKIAEALAPMQKAAALLPVDAEVHNILGAIFQDMGRLDSAEASYRRALEIKPDYAEACYNLGNILHDLGRLGEAEVEYRRALEIKPGLAEAHCNLGNTLLDLGRLDEAEASCRRALQIKPDYAEAHGNLGNIFYSLNRLGEAETSFRRALEIKPDYAVVHNNLGNTLQGLVRLNEAEASYRLAIQIKPDYAEAHNNLGSVLKNMFRLDESETSYRRALELKPGYEEAFSNLLFVLNYSPDKSGEEIFEVYREYDARFGLTHRNEWRSHGNSRETNRRLKVGYVSPDFTRHAVRHFLEPLLANHDRNTLEVYAYAELAGEDEVTARYKGYVDHWMPTSGMSDAALAERIRADDIDILVDLAGHTAHNRLGVFARKPSPVSLSWLGCGYSTGLTAIDYFLADEVIAPAGSEKLFSEAPWRLQAPCYVYRPAEGMGEPGPLPAMSAGHVTFGTLSRGVRINHRVIRIWSEILKCVKGARLVIDSNNFRDESMRDVLAEKFGAHGVGRDQLQMGCHSPPWDTLRGIDIGLDCFPHNSGTTLFETLYMGIPYITLMGRPSVGRIGSTVLEGVGHQEWIARTEDEYVENAVALAEDLTKLAELRARLRQEMRAGSLMDEPAFARKVEEAYRDMFGQWAKNTQTGS